MELNSKTVKKILLIILFSAVTFAATLNLSMAFLWLKRVIGIFTPIIAALCIAFVLNILLTAFETKVFKFMDKAKKQFVKKLKRPICLLLTYLLALGIVALLILVIIPDIVDTITYLAEKMPSFMLNVKNKLDELLNRFNIEQNNIPNIKINWKSLSNTIIAWISGSSGRLVDSAVNITASVLSGVFDAVFSLVISVYILADKEKIARFTNNMLNAFLKPKTTSFINHIAAKTNEAFSRFIGGQLVEALILGVLCFIGMSIFGFPNPLIVSVLISVTALVPIVGSAIGAIIGFLLIVITNPIKAVLFVVFLLILQQLENNIIYPRVVGKAVGLPGILVVSSVLVGGNIAGVFGALIAVPTAAVLYTLLKELIEFSVSKKHASHHL